MFRWFARAALVGCMSISAFYRRGARLEGETIPRRRERTLLLAGRGIVAIPLFVSTVMYVVNPDWMAWAPLAAPMWSRWTGVALGLLTVPAAYWVFSSLGRNVSETVFTKTHHALVTHGPYRWIRHPIYTTGGALVVAIGLIAANGFILVFALIAVALIRLVVVPIEEQELLTKFGDDYRDYMQRPGRLLPRVPGR